MAMHVKIFGMERTGTNFADVLIRSKFPNVRIHETVFGSKHGPFCAGRLPAKVQFVICIRNLRAWSGSFARWKIAKYGAAWPQTDRELEFDMMRWNQAYANWYERLILEGRAIVVRHADVLTSFDAVLTSLSKSFREVPVDWERIPKRIEEGRREGAIDFEKQFYTSGLYHDDEVALRCWPQILKLVDWNMMERYGIFPDSGYVPRSIYA